MKISRGGCGQSGEREQRTTYYVIECLEQTNDGLST